MKSAEQAESGPERVTARGVWKRACVRALVGRLDYISGYAWYSRTGCCEVATMWSQLVLRWAFGDMAGVGIRRATPALAVVRGAQWWPRGYCCVVIFCRREVASGVVVLESTTSIQACRRQECSWSEAAEVLTQEQLQDGEWLASWFWCLMS